MQQLALDHVLREIDENVQNAEITFLKRHLKRLHVKPIAGQHAAMIPPAGIRGGPAASRVGAIDDIVVDQRGAMNQFHDGAQPHSGSAAVARVSGGKQQKRGTQALASASQQIAGDLGHWFAREAGLLRQFLLDAREVVAHQIENLFNRQQ